MSIIDRIFALMKQKRITAKQLCEDFGYNRSKAGDWKRGKSQPNIEDLPKLAEYFHVSYEYLLTGKEKQQCESAPQLEDLREQQLYELFHKLNDDGKESLIAHAIGLSMMSKYVNLENTEETAQMANS